MALCPKRSWSFGSRWCSGNTCTTASSASGVTLTRTAMGWSAGTSTRTSPTEATWVKRWNSTSRSSQSGAQNSGSWTSFWYLGDFWPFILLQFLIILDNTYLQPVEKRWHLFYAIIKTHKKQGVQTLDGFINVLVKMLMSEFKASTMYFFSIWIILYCSYIHDVQINK